MNMTELLNKVLARSASLVAGSIVVSSSILAANAGNMYIYKDDSGQVLLTNVNLLVTLISTQKSQS